MTTKTDKILFSLLALLGLGAVVATQVYINSENALPKKHNKKPEVENVNLSTLPVPAKDIFGKSLAQIQRSIKNLKLTGDDCFVAAGTEFDSTVCFWKNRFYSYFVKYHSPRTLEKMIEDLKIAGPISDVVTINNTKANLMIFALPQINNFGITVTDKILEDQYEKEKAAKARLDNEKNTVSQREQYAHDADINFLDQGIDVKITLSGPYKTTIQFENGTLNRAAAYQLMKDQEFYYRLVGLRFRVVKFSNYFQTVTYNLE